MTPRAPLALALALALGAPAVLAQSKAIPAKPPIANYWMDVATVNVSIPGVEEVTDMPLVGGMVGNFFGGSKLGMVPGKWLDLALYTRQKPAGTNGTHAIPPGQIMGASLPLEPVPKPQPGGTAPDTKPEDVERQKPKGRLLLYWGCSETVRPGQPKILDMATAGPMDFAKFFSSVGGNGEDMILWSSSELPEAGLGLMDYLSNGQIDQWVKEKVLLPASTQRCAIPAGLYGQAGGAMLRGIAYGNELDLVHPPRPTDPKLLALWNPEWSLRVRVKSTTMSMLGQEAQAARQEKKSEPVNPLDILKKGIFGR